MTRRTRQRLFYVLLALFFVISAAVVFYAEGWRVDIFSWPWRAEKVGAIFVRSYPADAAITLDGKAVKNQTGILSGLFGSGTLISDLFPHTYSLSLAAPGYGAWHESASVLPSLVTELKYAVLVPRTATSVATSTARDALRFTLAGSTPVVETNAGTDITNGTTIGRGTVVAASADDTNIIMKTAADAYTLYAFASGSTTDLSAIFAANGFYGWNVRNIMINPGDATEIVVNTGGRIALFNTAADSFTMIARAAAGTEFGTPLAASASAIAWTHAVAGTRGTANTLVIIYDRSSQTIATSTAGVPGETVALHWIKPGLLGVLQNNGALYLYDTAAGTFQKLADTVAHFAATRDGSLVAALETHSLEVFSFTNAQTYHRFNLPNVTDATSIAWYGDMNHLFIVYPDRVSFLDLNDLSLTNYTTIADIADGTTPLYDPAANALYLIDPSHTLVRFDFPS